jgi:hypothetical protein
MKPAITGFVRNIMSGPAKACGDAVSASVAAKQTPAGKVRMFRNGIPASAERENKGCKKQWGKSPGNGPSTPCLNGMVIA